MPRQSSQKKKELKKHEESLRNILGNRKQNNIHIMGIPEGGQSKEGIENLFEEMMTKTSLMW